MLKYFIFCFICIRLSAQTITINPNEFDTPIQIINNKEYILTDTAYIINKTLYKMVDSVLSDNVKISEIELNRDINKLLNIGTQLDDNFDRLKVLGELLNNISIPLIKNSEVLLNDANSKLDSAQKRLDIAIDEIKKERRTKYFYGGVGLIIGALTIALIK